MLENSICIDLTPIQRYINTQSKNSIDTFYKFFKDLWVFSLTLISLFKHSKKCRGVRKFVLEKLSYMHVYASLVWNFWEFSFVWWYPVSSPIKKYTTQYPFNSQGRNNNPNNRKPIKSHFKLRVKSSISHTRVIRKSPENGYSISR
jgi:hypothetical protein